MGCVRVAAKEYVKQDENGTDKNGRIRDIEGRVTVGAEPNFKEIRDRAVNDAIGDVTGGATEQQRETREGHAAAALAGDQQPRKHGNDSDRADDQNDARGGGSGIGEDAERKTRIAAVHEIHEIVD